MTRKDDTTPWMILDAEHLILELSAPAAQMLGFDTTHALRGATFTDVASLHARPALEQTLEEFARTRAPTLLETTLIGARGRELEVCVTFEPRRDAPGARLQFVPLESSCPLFDRLKRTEARHGETLSRLNVGVVVHGPSTEILYWNPKALELLGLSADQLRGRSSFDPRWNVVAQDGEPLPWERHPVSVAISTRRPVPGVMMGVQRPDDDARVWLMVSAEPHLDQDGEVLEVVVTFTDVTQMRKLQRELADHQKMELVGVLARRIAHDFNNLLSVISMVSDLMMLDLPDQAPCVEDLKTIQEATRHGTELIRHLNNLAGGAESTSERHPIDDLLTELKPLLQRAGGDQMTLALDLQAPCASVRASPSQMEQILLNLVINARDAFIGPGTVTISTRRPDGSQLPGEVLLEIVDDGPGMAPEVKERVFEPFFTTKPPSEGTGLGLNSVHNIVRELGGAIEVDSRPGQGAHFKIRIPAALEPPRSPERDAMSAHPGHVPRRRHDTTILVVDDEELLRGAIATSLHRVGHHVLTAHDVASALDILDAQPVDLILTDVCMRNVSGLDLYHAVERRGLTGRTLLMSGHDRESLGRMGLKPEMPIIHKPFAIEALMLAIDELLEEAPSP